MLPYAGLAALAIACGGAGPDAPPASASAPAEAASPAAAPAGCATGPGRTTYFIAPHGSDSNDGLHAQAPLLTFAQAFARMRGGDELVLLDGTYGDAAGTGQIGGSPRSQVPSGSPGHDTLLRALNPGGARIAGDLVLGLKRQKTSRVTVQGLSFTGAGELYNTAFTTVKECGFLNGFYIGTNDHDQGNTDNLVEDVWVRAAGQRIIAINYRADRNVWRRVVVRGDGCGTPRCSGSGNPNVGITVYESVDVSLQNVIVVDRVLAPTDFGYGDFAVAAHDTRNAKMGRAEWLGVMSLNAPDDGFNMDPDGPHAIVAPTLTIRDAVVARPAGYGMYFGKAGIDNRFEHITIVDAGGAGFVAAESLTDPLVRHVLVSGARGVGVTVTPGTRHAPEHVHVQGAAKAAWGKYSRRCTVGCTTAAAGRSLLRHVTRVEARAMPQGGGRDIGARLEHRYGRAGTRFGEPGYNERTAVALWPWPNEARIRQDLCETTTPPTTRGFCATGPRLDGRRPVSFTSYVWELLGQPMPAGLDPR